MTPLEIIDMLINRAYFDGDDKTYRALLYVKQSLVAQMCHQPHSL